MTELPFLSIVVPCYNEKANLVPLITAIRETMTALNLGYEVVFADDGSTDDSWSILRAFGTEDIRIRAVRLEKNAGQSAALWAGVQAARGKYIATLDADLQNHPRELPKFLQVIESCDCVCGSRVQARAQGDSRLKQVSSLIANAIRNRLTHETVSDSACGYRVFRREAVARLKFFKGIHRFLPTLFRLEGLVVREIPINHYARLTGHSHYGVWNRVFVTIADLLAVRWMQQRMFRYEVREQINFPPATPPR